MLEVDEHQHTKSDYSPEQETKRMKCIYEDLAKLQPGVEVLFIRYNPDAYEGTQYNTTQRPLGGPGLQSQRLSYLYTLIIHFMNMKALGLPLGKILTFL